MIFIINIIRRLYYHQTNELSTKSEQKERHRAPGYFYFLRLFKFAFETVFALFLSSLSKRFKNENSRSDGCIERGGFSVHIDAHDGIAVLLDKP